MTMILSLGVLNPLLATIISDHNERANEVTLVLMVKYAIYLDYIHQKARTCCSCLPSFARKIQKHIDIAKTSVYFCNLPYCPSAKKKRGSHKRIQCYATPMGTGSEECEQEQLIAPHFECHFESKTTKL